MTSAAYQGGSRGMKYEVLQVQVFWNKWSIVGLLANVKYSRASLYTASFSTDFADILFSIDSKKFSIYTDFIE